MGKGTPMQTEEACNGSHLAASDDDDEGNEV
jgi:hypothetical protein